MTKCKVFRVIKNLKRRVPLCRTLSLCSSGLNLKWSRICLTLVREFYRFTFIECAYNYQRTMEGNSQRQRSSDWVKSGSDQTQRNKDGSDPCFVKRRHTNYHKLSSNVQNSLFPPKTNPQKQKVSQRSSSCRRVRLLLLALRKNTFRRKAEFLCSKNVRKIDSE